WAHACSRNCRNAVRVPGVAGPRCMSEASHTVPGRAMLFNDGGFLDDDVLGGYVLVEALAACFDALDLFNDLGAFDDLAEYGVAPAVGRGRGEVQEVVVGNVDEELCGGRMRVAGAGHGESVAVVLEAVVGFVLDGFVRGFLLHAGLEAAALDHEVADDAMEDRAVIEAFFDVGKKIVDGLGCFFGVKLDDHVAHAGLEFYAWSGAHGLAFCRSG